MEKRIAILIALSLFTVTVLSSWEGSAAVAPEGELPATGLYVATNSFPKNIVVDITNLETNKTARAIVANGLDTPGLLAIISREAAQLIGMRRGSVSTIRMVQPTEPVAYLRFAEGAAAGTPYYSSGDVIAEELYREDTYKPPVQLKETPENSITGPSYVLEPEWRARGATPYVPGTPADYFVNPAPAEKTEEPPVKTVIPTAEEKVEQTPECIAEPVPEEKPPVNIAEPVPEEKVEKEPEHITEPVPEEKIEEPPIQTEEPVKIAEVPPPKKEFILTPAEERPPENTIYGIDPADIIPGIKTTPPAEKNYNIDPEKIIPGITTAPPAKESEKPVPPPVVIDNAFSVSKITRLERGWYYVQIASFDNPESVENEVKQIDPRYSPVVYAANDSTYSILFGPLNQGESAAILQRFKSIGYKNAFIRHIK